MNRDFEPELRPHLAEMPPRASEREPEPSQVATPYRLGPYQYRLSESELKTMEEIGRFRTVAVTDLLRYRYGNHAEGLRRDLAALRAQGLVQLRRVGKPTSPKSLTVAVLTKPARALVEKSVPEFPQGFSRAKQAFYSGLVKPAEVRHDAAIYRMFQAERAKIEGAGGRIKRVVLDYELKKKVYRPLAKIRTQVSPAEYAKRQAEVAAENGLKVVGGKVLLPDLRIEYETPAGTGASVDLELATHHYRGGAMRGKAQAGFKLYAPADAAARLASAFDPEFVADIFSF